MNFVLIISLGLLDFYSFFSLVILGLSHCFLGYLSFLVFRQQQQTRFHFLIYPSNNSATSSTVISIQISHLQQFCWCYFLSLKIQNCLICMHDKHILYTEMRKKPLQLAGSNHYHEQWRNDWKHKLNNFSPHSNTCLNLQPMTLH